MSVKKVFISGVLWISIAKYSGVVVALLISAVLARLLPPSDFGVIAIAAVFINFFTLLTDFGFGPAIIQKDDLDKKDYNSIFSFTAVLGLVMGLCLFFTAPAIARYYSNDLVVPVVRLLSLNVFFATINIVPNALLLKAKKFKIIALRTLLFQIVSGSIAIILAFEGLGVFSLALQSVTACIGIFIYNYVQNPLKITACLSSVKKIFSYSLFQFLSNLIGFFTKNLDNLLIGRYMDMQQLGYYEKSYRLMRMPIDNLSYVIAPVMQPIFRDYQHDISAIYTKFMRMVRFLCYICFPLTAYLYFAAGDLIRLVYGPQWEAAVMPFKLFSITSGLLVLLATTGPIYQATNKIRTMFVVCLIEGILGIGCLYVGLQWHTINAVAAGVSVGILLRFCATFFILHRFVFNKPLLAFVRQLIPPTGITLLLGLIYYAFVTLFPTVGRILSLSIMTTLFILCVGISMLATKQVLISIKNKKITIQ